MRDVKMSDVTKLFCIIVLSLIVSSCGFQPVHQKSTTTEGVSVPVLKGSRTEQIFSIALDELLNASTQDAAKRYSLDLNFKREETPAIIQQDRTITRYRIILTANYTLKQGDAEITKGVAKIRTSYDDLASDFGSYSAQADSEERAAKELAQKVYQRLQGFLVKP